MTGLVDHARDHELTVQGSQGARAWALGHLTEVPGLPTISTWMIDAFTKTLIGLAEAGAGEGPADQRRKVQAWADYLRVDAEEFTADGVTTVSVQGPCEYGVRVRISTQLPAAVQEAAA
jgi:hypothetical protein